MRLVPIVVLVSADTIARLEPVITDAMEKVAPFCKTTAALLNGWTPEAVAYGMVLEAASHEDIEVMAK